MVGGALSRDDLVRSCSHLVGDRPLFVTSPPRPAAQRQPSKACARPEHHFRITVLADHLRVNRTWLDVERSSERGTKPSRVQHRPGADHPRERQP